MLCESADVNSTAMIDESASVWHLAQVREGARIDAGVVIGRGVYIGPGVHIGANSKIQNYALIYEPSKLEAGVFIGPGVILTNDLRPRAVNPDGFPKASQDWEPVGVTVLEGASLGARAVCVAPITIGRWSMVAAGAVVVDDVPDHALVVGVPARRIGWVSRDGARLERVPGSEDRWECSNSGTKYRETSKGTLVELPSPIN
jgi:UDP-3-O-[3-hydroxymyristoyl] glucosamine N-acyltransferase